MEHFNAYELANIFDIEIVDCANEAQVFAVVCDWLRWHTTDVIVNADGIVSYRKF